MSPGSRASEGGGPPGEEEARPPPGAQWFEQNQRHVVASLALLRVHLDGGGAQAATRAARQLDAIGAELRSPPAIERFTRVFRLSPFERDVLMLCAGVELDDDFAAACAAAQGDPQRPQPTFALALARLPGAHWSALGPMAPLRRFHLIEVGQGPALVRSPLHVDEWALHALAGVHQLDPRLAGLLEPPQSPDPLAPSQQRVADRLVALWSGQGALPPLQLCGEDRAGKRAVATAAASALRMRLDVLPAGALAGTAVDGLLPRLLTREALLGCSALLVDGEELDGVDAAAAPSVHRLLEQLRTPTLLAVRDRLRLPRQTIALDVHRPTRAEQHAIWKATLAPALTGGGDADRMVAPLARQFDLPAPAIRSACAAALAAAPAGAALGEALWEACRAEARPRLEELAQRIEPAAAWADLVLPAPQVEALREIAMHVRRRSTVYGDWGFEKKSSRGLGISALFAGQSGTGKTMASEVLARELGLDLFRIDLSQVVSKYIGETEKNLRRVFDAAEHGAALLLFDEADALFGQRSEVKDAHDRYANIEVGYLLQRMECYRGLAILTTNRKNALDPAFLRRLRFVVQFPFPGPPERAEIWRRAFPPETPLEPLDVPHLARLNIAGGSIRNIAVQAAFLAAEEGTAVRMAHVHRATLGEFSKLGRPLTGEEGR